ncbi:PP2C family protein-serine/threonine phosphatase [Streptomyces venezuelae]|uniref:PP2C family protein-serine/threonine phosphatase n=1 Tax=Streptomyces venezuelae TaxID=54571 RepID=UPI0037913ED7
MTCRAGTGPDDADEADGGTSSDSMFAALLEDSAEELYENAPCGYLSTLMDGTVVKINGTLLDWLGLDREAVVGRLRFTDLLTVGGRLYHETHFAPLLRMRGEISGVALEVRQTDGGRRPVLVSAVIKYGSTGTPLLTRITVFDATDRRAYETELLRSRRAAEESARQARADRARLQQALAVLQESLLPSSLPPIPGVETVTYYHTASPDQLGGDFYDVFPLDGKRFGFFLGDVCGKGPQAAAVTSLTRYTLRAAALHDPDPVAALTTLNQVLHDRYSADDPRFCTVIFGVLDPDPVSGYVSVELASGGHPPALVLRGGGTADYLPTPGGLLVGALPDPRFTAARTTLAPGDTLLLYTDGVTEARTGADRSDLFGDEALRAFTAEHAGTSAEDVVGALTDLLAGLGEGLDDDTALLALGASAPAPTTDNATTKTTP